jgi:acyl carrier protein
MMLTPSQVRAAAQQVVAEMVGKQVKDDDSLIASGLIDSLSILKLIGNLEKRLSAAIPANDLQPDDFETIDYITDTVLRVAKS